MEEVKFNGGAVGNGGGGFAACPLPYAYDALQPVIDEETMRFHHDKHYQTYVDNLNKALADYPKLQSLSVGELLMRTDEIPPEIKTAVVNNGGGVYNHELYFCSMRPVGDSGPKGELAAAIDRDFGSLEGFQEKMKDAALTQFGSGWAWLLTDENGKLSIRKTANQDVPNLRMFKPLFLVDVWEHAYYLQYQNLRASYVENWFSLIDWEKAEKRYQSRNA